MIVCAMLVGLIFGGIAGWGSGWLSCLAAHRNQPTEGYESGYRAGMLAVNDLIRGTRRDGSHRFDIVETGE